jgi:hypothetical protein
MDETSARSAARRNDAIEAGALSPRVLIKWNEIEPTRTDPPTYVWTAVDDVLLPLEEAGFAPVVVVLGNPNWAVPANVPTQWKACGPLLASGRSALAELMASLVERYDGDGTGDAPGSPVITRWEMYNEPDFDPAHAGGEDGHGGCWAGDVDADATPDPHEYAELLHQIYPQVQSASSEASLLFGGIAMERFYDLPGYQGPAGPFRYTFTDEVLDYLAATYGTGGSFPFFDAMNFHTYNDFRNQWDGPTLPYDQELVGKAKHVRNFKLTGPGYDLSGMPLLITEMGLMSGPSDQYTTRSEGLQALYVPQAFARVRAANLELSTWFMLIDDPRFGTYYQWGLLREDTTRKPSYTAYQVITQQLPTTASYDRQLTPTETGSSNIIAFRFQLDGGPYKIVAFTDNGERLGRVGFPAVQRSMTFNSSLFPDWTGRLKVVSHLGAETIYSGATTLTITQAPVYVFPVP